MTGLWAGGIALALLVAFVGGALAALAGVAAEVDPWAVVGDPYVRHVAGFTVMQALLSAGVSVGLAVPLARALARRPAFPGRALLIHLFGLPLVCPAIVAVFGIVAVWGQAGLVSRLAVAVGLPGLPSLYGLPGILLVHVFFNLPLAVRLLLPLWQAVPGETWRVASQLGMGSGAIFRLIEGPLVRQVAPGVFGLVFMLCFTSFAVVLALGGGPAAATLEVAVYQALRFDFDLGRAVSLALLQVGICAVLVVAAQAAARPMPQAAATGRPHDRPDRHGLAGRLADAAVIAAGGLFVLLPPAAVVVEGITGPLARVLAQDWLWRAAGRSLAVAAAAGVLALVLGGALLLAVRALRRRRVRLDGVVDLFGSLTLVVPPLVLGAGLFVLLRPLVDPFALSLVLVALVNAVMALPYVLRVLGPPALQAADQHDRLCAGLGIDGWRRLRLIDTPVLRAPAGLALALAMALSTGDLGVVALFGTSDGATLPLELYRLLAGYRMGEAAVVALVLLALSLVLFVVVERGVGGRGRT